MATTMMRFNDGGRPLFARDNDKHMTPAPSQYRPDRFLKKIKMSMEKVLKMVIKLKNVFHRI